MTCFNPIPAWISKERNPNTNKSMVVFSPPGRLDKFRSIQVPCGQCIGCRLDYSRSWAVRCCNEMQLHDQNCYLTLTYDNEHLPWSAMTGEMTLRKRDLQLFMKRLRKAFSDKKIRYFGAGEYGDLTNRPHYHMILFGHDFEDKKLYKVSDLGFNYWISDQLEDIWQQGQCVIGDVSFDSCAYVARYCLKKLKGVDNGKYDGIEKEFAVMSRRPGIGFDWLRKYGGDVYPSDNIVIPDRGNWRSCRPPRYYDIIFGNNHPGDLEAIKEKRVLASMKEFDENCVAGRYDQKAEVKKAQLDLCKRSL